MKENNDVEVEIALYYLKGRIEKEIEHYAQALGLPCEFVTERVVKILGGPAIRTVRRIENRLPEVQEPAAKAVKVQSPKVALAGSPRKYVRKRTRRWRCPCGKLLSAQGKVIHQRSCVEYQQKVVSMIANVT